MAHLVPVERLVDERDAREPLHAGHPVPAGNDEPKREPVLRRQRHAVDLVREERIASEQHLEGKAPLVDLLLTALDTAVEAGEQRIGRAGRDACLLEQLRDAHSAPASGPNCLEKPRLAHDVRFDVHAAVARALHRHGDLDGRARAEVVERQRERALDEPADLQPPRGGIDLRDVVVDEEVVQADRRDVPAERLEWQRVVARRQLELLDADHLAHARAR